MRRILESCLRLCTFGLLGGASSAQDSPPRPDTPRAKTVKVFLLAGQSNMQGQAVIDLDHEESYNGGRGTLEFLMRDPVKSPLFEHLKNENGEWVARRPEFAGTVTLVETRAFLRKAEDSPNTGHGHHRYGNAESYFLIGDAFGKAMLALLESPARSRQQ